MTSNWLTLDDIAAELGLHRDTVAAAASRGEIPLTKIGNRWRVSVELWARYRNGDWQPRAKVEPIQMLHRRSERTG